MITEHKSYIPSVYIVILNWNQTEDTCECLKSLANLDYQNYRVVVIDNGSVDGSSEVILERYPYVTLLRNNTNLGFTSGNNVGIKFSLAKGADYIFLLNNDTIVDPQILTKLIEISELDEKIAVVGPQIFYYSEPEKLWFFGANILWPFANTKIWHQNEIRPYSDELVLDTDFVAGAGMLIRSSVIRKLGMLDPYFFIYFEDAELCIRFLKAGYKIKSVSSAHMWHKVSSAATAGNISNFLVGRNQLYFCRKYNDAFSFWFKIVPYLLFLRIKEFIFCRFSRNSLFTLIGMLAYFGGYRDREGIDWIAKKSKFNFMPLIKKCIRNFPLTSFIYLQLSIIPHVLKKSFAITGIKYCHSCGYYSLFYWNNFYETLMRNTVPKWGGDNNYVRQIIKRENELCTNCGSNLRIRMLAKTILGLLNFSRLSHFVNFLKIKPSFVVYETANYALFRNRKLRKVKNYIVSEFHPGYPFRQEVNGIRNENLEKLSFRDKSIDILITGDVLEHVSDLKKSLFEVYRVLKNGGYHVFTVPVNYSLNKTRTRALVDSDGKIINLLPPVIHGDNINIAEGVLVYRDFGADIMELIEQYGFSCKEKKYFSAGDYTGHVYIAQKI